MQTCANDDIIIIIIIRDVMYASFVEPMDYVLILRGMPDQS